MSPSRFAKGQLERRADRAKGDPRARPRNRRPALLPGEPYAEGLRRVILGQLDLAVELLEGHTTESGERTVHETRKALKRLRALLVLLRAELGAKRYARENAALRDCGRRLAGARDAEVMLGTLDSLVRRDPSHFKRSAAVRTLRAQLLAERDDAAAHAIHDARVRGEVVIELRAVRARVARWELRERGFRLLAPGLEGIYKRGSRADARRAPARRRRAARGRAPPREARPARPGRQARQAGPERGGAPRLAQTRQGAALRRRDARPRRQGAASRCAASPAAPTGSGKCSARSTTSHCSKRGCAIARVRSRAIARCASGCWC